MTEGPGEECKHGLELAWCSWCKPKGATRAMRDARLKRRQIANSFQAQYDGQCSECGGDIEMGNAIRHADDGTYTHADCS